MTKKEKIAWAMARIFDIDSSDNLDNLDVRYVIDTEPDECSECGSSKENEKEVLVPGSIDLLYKAYVAAKKVDQGK